MPKAVHTGIFTTHDAHLFGHSVASCLIEIPAERKLNAPTSNPTMQHPDVVWGPDPQSVYTTQCTSIQGLVVLLYSVTEDALEARFGWSWRCLGYRSSICPRTGVTQENFETSEWQSQLLRSSDSTWDLGLGV